jgi:hypothetical protein
MPAKPRNRNALQSGRFAFITSGSLPRGCSYVSRLLRGFRGALEKAVRDVHGEVSIAHALLIQTASRHEGTSILCQRWLRQRLDALTDADRLLYLRQIAQSSDARDRCVKQLGLDRVDAHRVINVLYADAPAAASTDDSPATTEAADNGR